MPGVPPGAMAHWMADHSWAASAYPSNYVIGTYIILFYTWYFPTSGPKITFFWGWRGLPIYVVLSKLQYMYNSPNIIRLRFYLEYIIHQRLKKIDFQKGFLYFTTSYLLNLGHKMILSPPYNNVMFY